MAPHRPVRLSANITWHLAVALTAIALVLAAGIIVVLGLSQLRDIAAVILLSALAVAAAAAMVLLLLIVVDRIDCIEDALNALIRLSLPEKKVSTGTEGLIGASATITEHFRISNGKWQGKVRVGSEIWSAEFTRPGKVTPEPGSLVTVRAVHGLDLEVEPRKN